MRFFKKYELDASMTVEAAIVVPIFIYAILTILSVIEIFRAYTDIENSLHSAGREIALYGIVDDKIDEITDVDGIADDFLETVISDGYAYARLCKDYTAENGNSVSVTEGGISAISLLESTVDSDNGIVDLSLMYQVGPIYNFFDTENQILVNRCRFHLWTGYGAIGEDSDDAERMVYITETGTVYHLSRSCSYLDLSIRSINAEELDTERNKSGAVYQPCELCNPSPEGTVYVTDYGDVYHNSLTCSGLKRTIYEVPLSEVGDKHVCSACCKD